MGPVAPDDAAEAIDRLLARIDTAANSVEPIDEPITVELVVESGTTSSSWFVRLDDTGGRAARGPASDPNVVIRIDTDTFASLRSGALNMQRAIDGGRLHVRGDLGALARARPALRALAAALSTGST
jgi:hypothetical protein